MVVERGLAFWGGDIHRAIADKIYYLNRALNSVDLFYEVALPRIWSCEHPLGSIMGRAPYGENFFLCKGVLWVAIKIDAPQKLIIR